MSKLTDERATPSWVIPWLRHSCGVHIWLDACATAENAVCQNYLTKEDDGLSYDWALTHSEMREARRFTRSWYVWMNPPYSRGQVTLWLDKAVEEWQRDKVQTIALLPQDMSTRWADHLWLPVRPGSMVMKPRFQMVMFKGRLHFEQMETGAMFASALVVIGEQLPRPMPMIARVDARELRERWTP